MSSQVPKIIVSSDYVCPYCLLAEGVIDEVAEQTGAEVEWRPFELRPHPTPTLRPEDDYLPRVWRASVYPMARRMNVPIVLPRISPQPYTHTAFEGFQYAKEHGLAREYNARVLRAFFQEERDIGRVDVLTEIAAELGLDAEEYREALESRRYRDVHQAALAQAHADRVSAVPTILVGDGRITGVPDREQLLALVRQQTAEQAPGEQVDAPTR